MKMICFTEWNTEERDQVNNSIVDLVSATVIKDTPECSTLPNSALVIYLTMLVLPLVPLGASQHQWPQSFHFGILDVFCQKVKPTT